MRIILVALCTLHKLETVLQHYITSFIQVIPYCCWSDLMGVSVFVITFVTLSEVLLKPLAAPFKHY